MTSMSSLETVVVGCLFGEIKGSNEYGMIERYYLTFHVETVCPCDHVIRYNINFSVIS